MQAKPEKASQYAVEVLDEALDGVTGTTALHMCFGYAAIHAWRGLGKPDAYAFLPELNASAIDQISIEAAQPGIDLDILERLPDKAVVLGVIDNGDATVETPETVAQRIRDALRYVAAERLIPAPDCGMKYLSREVAFAKLSALAAGGRHRAGGTGGLTDRTGHRRPDPPHPRAGGGGTIRDALRPRRRSERHPAPQPDRR